MSSVNHLSEYILEKTDMPDELVKTVQGTTVFEQTLPQVNSPPSILNENIREFSYWDLQ